jgi:hypothetical protein
MNFNLNMIFFTVNEAKNKFKTLDKEEVKKCFVHGTDLAYFVVLYLHQSICL